MMNYEDFKNYVIENIGDYLPETMKGANLIVGRILKVNSVRDTIRFEVENADYFYPNIYIDDMYECYQEEDGIDSLLENAVENMQRQTRSKEEVRDILNIDNIKDKIVMELVNTGQNKKFLENRPHREFEDLSIIYVANIPEENRNIKVQINHALADKYEMSEPELYELAWKNMRANNYTHIRPLMSLLIERITGEDLPFPFESEDKNLLYVISNANNENGAIAMLDKEALHKFAEKLGSDLYLIPSNVDEAVVTKTEGITADALAQMTYEVKGEIPFEKRLSNQVYQYYRDSMEIKCVTDMPQDLDETNENVVSQSM